MINALQNKIRYEVYRFIFDNGYAPTVSQLSALLTTEGNKIEAGLKALADNHAIVLHPNSYDIWVAHPFALYPTLFWVKTKHKHWWGNCPWCSFGIASLTKTDTDIFTKLKGQDEPLLIEIRNTQVVQKNYVVNFPISASKFWNNIIYTCSMMLIFKNETQIDEWCKQHNKPKGEVLPIEQVWKLAQLWYGKYLDPDFKGKTKEWAEDIFAQIGLTSNFWKL